MKPTQLRLVPTSHKVIDDLKIREDYVNTQGSAPEVGDKNGESVTTDVAVVGECARFDLSVDDDRQAYAKLSARLFSGVDCIRLWEERALHNDSLIVYVNYINYTNVYQNRTRVINLKDE